MLKTTRKNFIRTATTASVAAAASALLAPLAPVARAQSGFGGINSFRRLDDAEVQAILKKVRSSQIGEVCLKFTIKHVPRKSDDTVTYTGVLWAGRRGGANVFRLELAPPEKSGKPPLRLLLKCGTDGQLWTNNGPNGTPVRADATSNAPFYSGLIFTPLELQTPFLFWPKIQYTKTARFRGRPTHFFEAIPPDDFRTANPKIGAVQFGTDKGFDNFVILQAIVLDSAGDPLRKFEAESFTNVKGIYVPEEMRVLDTVSRDKDIFRVTAAAVNIQHAHSTFLPKTLNEPAPQPPETAFAKVN
jgi:hypothetical protein